MMPNLSRKSALSCAMAAIERLHTLRAEVLLDQKYKEPFAAEPYIRCVSFEEGLESCDIVIAVGGDGTILHTAKHAVQKNKPIIGINAGRLGFLAGLEANELDRLENLTTGRYTIDKRMMLKITHCRGNEQQIFYALNDAVVSKGIVAKIVDLDIFCDGREMAFYRADGIIFSTPTGSTAYALSAGGPVIDPAIDCISMTPICSHSLLGQSIVFSADRKLSVTAHMDEEHAAYLSVDGENGIQIQYQDRIEIEKSDIFVHFVKLIDKPFFEILNEKILDKIKH